MPRPFPPNLRPLLAIVWLLPLLPGCARTPGPASRVTIVASPGPLGGVDSAAAAGSRVDWWGGNVAAQDAATECFAAAELRELLPRVLGLAPERVVLSATTALPDSGDVIVLGSARSSALVASLGARGDTTSSTPDAYRITARVQGGRRVVVVQGRGRTGTLYGAYGLLERLGVRFYGLGDTGTVFPAAPARLPDRLDTQSAPAFRTRGFWAWEARGNPDFFRWMARNRMNLWSAAEPEAGRLEQLGIRLAAGGHSIQAMFLPPMGPGEAGVPGYFASHPEWYGLHAGRRSPRLAGESGDNFCTANAEARRTLAANLVTSLAGGSLRRADVVNVWPLDGGRWCECDACRRQGPPSDRWLAVLAGVRDAVAAARRDGRLTRDVRLAAPAYLETLEPPVSPATPDPEGVTTAITFFPYFRCYVHALADPACTEINARLARAFLGWRPASVGEYYNVSWVKSLPIVYPHVMAADLAWYHAQGVDDFSYMHAPTRAWGTWTLDHAVLSRLLWNPAADVDSIEGEFCERYYATTATHMKSFYAQLEPALANWTALKVCAGVAGVSGASAGRLTEPSIPILRLRHLQDSTRAVGANSGESLEEMLSRMAAARAAIDSAIAAARDANERARLAEDATRFRYGEATLGYHVALIRTALRDRAGDREGARRELALATRYREALRGVTDPIHVAGAHADAVDGVEAAGLDRTYEFFARRLAAANMPR